MAPKPGEESDGLPSDEDSSDDEEAAKAPVAVPAAAPKPAATAGAPAAAAAGATAIELAEEAKAGVMAAASELSNFHLPTAEELAESKKHAAEEAERAKAAAAALVQEMKSDAEALKIDMNKLPESQRMNAYIDALAEKSDGKLPEWVRPALLKVIGLCLAIQPWFAYVAKYASKFWAMLPKNLVLMLFGGALCYFGGAYTTSIAAVEAFRTMGYERARQDILKVQAELERVAEVDAADDLADDDGDGIADVDQIPPSELVRRKLYLYGVTIKEPERFQSALAGVWSALLAVLATLSLPFAATTAIALGILDMIRFSAVRLLTPSLIAVMGPELRHWTTTLIESTLAFVIIVTAWWAQHTVGAVYASLRGGRLFADGFFGLIIDQANKGIHLCPGLIGKDFDSNESVLDEIVAYIIAAQGLMFQLTQGFVLPFPFNILLLPLNIVDWLLKVQVSVLGGAGSCDS